MPAKGQLPHKGHAREGLGPADHPFVAFPHPAAVAEHPQAARHRADAQAHVHRLDRPAGGNGAAQQQHVRRGLEVGEIGGGVKAGGGRVAPMHVTGQKTRLAHGEPRHPEDRSKLALTAA
jgi:hypothetical protein